MLSGQTQMHYYANHNDTSTFDQVCTNMQLFFENLKWQRLNLTKWQTFSLTNIISANPTLFTTEYLWKFCIKFITIRPDLNPVYHGIVQLRKNIIWVCKGNSVLTTGLTYPLLDILGNVNNLYNSIINYELIHKPSSIENYIQVETNWHDDDEIFFTNP